MEKSNIATFKRRLLLAHGRSLLTDAEIGRRANVHRGQVGRILKGEFSTFSENAVSVGRVLGVPCDSSVKPDVHSIASWIRLEEKLLELWDGSDDGAELILGLFDSLAGLIEHRTAAARAQSALVRGRSSNSIKPNGNDA